MILEYRVIFYTIKWIFEIQIKNEFLILQNESIILEKSQYFLILEFYFLIKEIHFSN